MTSVYTITMTQHELSTEKHVNYIYTTKTHYDNVDTWIMYTWRQRQNNKGNAKRGVSPHLKIWPGDLENQLKDVDFRVFTRMLRKDGSVTISELANIIGPVGHDHQNFIRSGISESWAGPIVLLFVSQKSLLWCVGK
jgi:hypothetical protein